MNDVIELLEESYRALDAAEALAPQPPRRERVHDRMVRTRRQADKRLRQGADICR